MTLFLKLNLVTTQADITAAFLHAKLQDGEDTCVHQAQGFCCSSNNGEEYRYKLNRSLYGLKQFDPCLFIGDKVIVLVYVDNIPLQAKNNNNINSLIEILKTKDILIRHESSAEGFLGINIKCNGNKITLTQSGLAKHIIESLRLCTENSPYKHKDGTPASDNINYPSTIGMILYVAGHSHPDIAFAICQCARYIFKPTIKLKAALKRIGRCIKGTIDKGLILNPTKKIQVETLILLVSMDTKTSKIPIVSEAKLDLFSLCAVALCFGSCIYKLRL
ncbi:hypothetical protein ACHAW6_004298 [Cyclotella cf. meneghiniana]